MSRKDFQLIAEVLATEPETHTRLRLAVAFADRLARTNGRFDRARFLRAAGADLANE
jgi:hypothetical protein